MRHPDIEEITLPLGVMEGGERHLTALLRPLSGREEELLATLPVEMSVAERVTAVLARCLERLGRAEADTDRVRRLAVGDREALLLHLRRLTMGDRIDCVARCSQDACGEPIDLSFRARELLLAPYENVMEWRQESVSVGDGSVSVRFRLPTGADQEAVAWLARADAASAARQLLARCVEPVDGDDDPLELLAEEGVAALSSRMAELDPQAELWLRTDCPACGSEVVSLLDAAAFLFAETAAASQQLYEEVHALAWHYHWAEGDILDLTATRRRRYLDLIASSLAQATREGVA